MGKYSPAINKQSGAMHRRRAILSSARLVRVLDMIDFGNSDLISRQLLCRWQRIRLLLEPAEKERERESLQDGVAMKGWKWDSHLDKFVRTGVDLGMFKRQTSQT